uniref:Cytochrome b561 domain-containing protein n=1 Tax=Emiliania huxleyi TaxID=2903 RepID=A0A7S3RTD0_EMIHU
MPPLPPSPPPSPHSPPRTYSAPKLAVTYAIHAVLMGLAWLALAPLGAAIARYSAKAVGGSGGGGGKQPVVWFHLHRGLMAGAVLLTVAGATVSYSMVEEHHSYTHSVLGTAMLAGCVLQGAGGAIRPAKESPYRRAWRRAHRAGGHVVWAVGLATATTGAFLYDDLLAEREQAGGGVAKALALVMVGVWAAVWAVLEVRAWWRHESSSDGAAKVETRAHGSAGVRARRAEPESSHDC